MKSHTRQRLSQALFIVAALGAGTLAGLFIILNAVFPGESTSAQRFIDLAGTTLAYALLGTVFSLAKPQVGWAWGPILGLPALLTLALYSFVNMNPLLYLAYIMVAMGSATFGGNAGAWLRSRQVRRKSPIQLKR